jgi:lambda repressor-like predicted transcriptional regulator
MKNRELKSQIFRQFNTLTDFSRVVGMRDDRLSKIIHGRTQPTNEEKAVISRKLGVPPQEIFSRN